MLGLIIDVRAPQATFPAATLSRVWVLRFVYLVFPIRLYNDHKYSSPPNSTKTSRDERLLLEAWVFSCFWRLFRAQVEKPVEAIFRQLLMNLDIIYKLQGHFASYCIVKWKFPMLFGLKLCWLEVGAEIYHLRALRSGTKLDSSAKIYPCQWGRTGKIWSAAKWQFLWKSSYFSNKLGRTRRWL